MSVMNMCSSEWFYKDRNDRAGLMLQPEIGWQTTDFGVIREDYRIAISQVCCTVSNFTRLVQLQYTVNGDIRRVGNRDLTEEQ